MEVLKVFVNGQVAEVSRSSTLLDLVLSYKIGVDGVIVSVNDRVPNRDEWKVILIGEGDCIEFVSLVGGG